MRKLGMKQLSTISSIWKKLNKEGISFKSIFEDKNSAGFTSITDEELTEYKKNISASELEEMNAIGLSMQKSIIAKIKEEKEENIKKGELLDKIIGCIDSIASEVEEVVMHCEGLTASELNEKYSEDLAGYLTSVTSIFKENIDFFTSLAKLNRKQ